MWYIHCTYTATVGSPCCFETSHKLEIATNRTSNELTLKKSTIFHWQFQATDPRYQFILALLKTNFFPHSDGRQTAPAGANS